MPGRDRVQRVQQDEPGAVGGGAAGGGGQVAEVAHPPRTGRVQRVQLQHPAPGRAAAAAIRAGVTITGVSPRAVRQRW